MRQQAWARAADARATNRKHNGCAPATETLRSQETSRRRPFVAVHGRTCRPLQEFASRSKHASTIGIGRPRWGDSRPRFSGVGCDVLSLAPACHAGGRANRPLQDIATAVQERRRFLRRRHVAVQRNGKCFRLDGRHRRGRGHRRRQTLGALARGRSGRGGLLLVDHRRVGRSTSHRPALHALHRHAISCLGASGTLPLRAIRGSARVSPPPAHAAARQHPAVRPVSPDRPRLSRLHVTGAQPAGRFSHRCRTVRRGQRRGARSAV